MLPTSHCVPPEVARDKVRTAYDHFNPGGGDKLMIRYHYLFFNGCASDPGCSTPLTDMTPGHRNGSGERSGGGTSSRSMPPSAGGSTPPTPRRWRTGSGSSPSGAQDAVRLRVRRFQRGHEAGLACRRGVPGGAALCDQGRGQAENTPALPVNDLPPCHGMGGARRRIPIVYPDRVVGSAVGGPAFGDAVSENSRIDAPPSALRRTIGPLPAKP